MSQQFLFKYEDNYADEFDVSGHCIIDQLRYHAFLEAMERVGYFAFYFGTNEEIEYYDKQSILDVVNVQAITDEQANTLKELRVDKVGCARSFLNTVIDRYFDEYKYN